MIGNGVPDRGSFVFDGALTAITRKALDRESFIRRVTCYMRMLIMRRL